MSEHEGSKEHGSSGGGTSTGRLTLQRAVDLGEYKPEILARYSDWHLLSRHGQLQFIRKGIHNRKAQLMTQYAELFNVLDFSEKRTELEPRLNHILDLVKEVDRDDEYYLAHYV